MRKRAVVIAGLLLASLALGQDQQSKDNTGSMPGMPAMPGMQRDGLAPVMHAMQSRHMDTGPHMKMTALREPRPGDAQRAALVVDSARKVARKYRDYRTALADGFKIFLPNVPQKQYHFTNYGYAFEARLRFNPDHPTSLLYEKRGDGYKLIGVMYTAAPDAPPDELNQRIPLSIAQWHAHVNLCLPPEAKRSDVLSPKPQFGLAGSINTRQACEAAGGSFLPQIFGWMVHVYPFEKNSADIWSVDRQMRAHRD